MLLMLVSYASCLNSRLLDKVLMWYHWLLFANSYVISVPSPQNLLQLSITLMNVHLAVHLCCICNECSLVCSESQEDGIHIFLYCRS